MKLPRSICVIDDEVAVQRSLTSLLRVLGVRVDVYSSSETFLDRNIQEWPCCLLVDALMPGMGGIGLLQELRRQGNAVPVILMTGNAGCSFRQHAIEAGAAEVLEKPFRVQVLLDLLKRLCPECFPNFNEESDAE